ncbi:ArsR/SmtB family transcription factor [Desulfoferrobacter suflitae]|uniref:ArsR/SmtB family transcription factor n=1 Tax=Desulfoferrobacter suflitae TaxID=2865782 RepID=UPI002164AC87|nr:metalloregulator ArsR/SmtB family transcription factor [Desulfoferrobacter suflitae]MCK8603776.1 metalloregulator ArsR/SmtB family transcription factor [Desulfoferrobacter suflitae]
MKEFVKVTKALSEPNRVKILKLLQRRSMYVFEIQEILSIAQATVSSHLKLLTDAGLVVYQKDGLWVSYRLADGSSSPYAASILGHLKHWLENSPDVLELAARLPAVQQKRAVQKSA